jgi:acetyl-CoA synthetase
MAETTMLGGGLLYPPSEVFKKKAQVADNSLYELAAQDRLGFWALMAESLEWYQKWDTLFNDKQAPFYQWYLGGKINACYNCVDRHTRSSRRNKAAIIFEGESGETITLTYQQLYREVNKFAGALKNIGVKKGDRVTIYMPMIPEVVVAMLAIVRIGALHSIVFGGFSVDALKNRIMDAESNVLITADGSFRRGKTIPLKENADMALEACPSVKKVVVVKRTGLEVSMREERDLWYHDLMKDAPPYCEPEIMDAEDPMFILYTSGTTGKPKGVLHTTGGYMVGAHATFQYVFDHHDEDIYWCTADIGWVTGHSYIVYGPLSNGSTVLIFEGAPDYPERDRWWEIIEKHRVNVFYTAPTAIRACMSWGTQWPEKRDLSSLRLLGSVGEPINPEAWNWFYENIGHKNCPISDTWWQTETGVIVITPLPGVTPLKPGSAAKPFPGIEVDIFDEEGNPVPEGESGSLVITSSFPSMLRSLYNNPERYVDTYWKTYPGYYFAGDGAMRDKDGYYWILGRVDDVIKISGHRLGTAEVESALVDHKAVAEAAVIGKAHAIKGHAISAFVTLKEGIEGTEELAKELKAHVSSKIGSLAAPEDIFFTKDLPKTRSGKIMRRLLRDLVEGRPIGDTTTLLDPGVLAAIKEKIDKAKNISQ